MNSLRTGLAIHATIVLAAVTMNLTFSTAAWAKLRRTPPSKQTSEPTTSPSSGETNTNTGAESGSSGSPSTDGSESSPSDPIPDPTPPPPDPVPPPPDPVPPPQTGGSGIPLPSVGVYPRGDQIGFGLYAIAGNSRVDPTLSNMKRVAQAGFTLAGPYYNVDWQNFQHIYDAASEGLGFTFQIRPPQELVGVSVADRTQELDKLTNAQMAASVREQVEAVLADPIARDTVARWSLRLEELRHWRASEMRYLEVVSQTIRQVEQEMGVEHRPFWMYEPNHRNVDALLLTGVYQDIISKGNYLSALERGPLRSGEAIWSMTQTVQAAQQLGKVPQGVFAMYQDFTDPKTGTDPVEIRRLLRHDVYLGLALGMKSFNVYSMYEDRPNFTTHNDQFLAYASVAQDLTGELDLQKVFLNGVQKNDLTITIENGTKTVDYTDFYGDRFTFDTLHHYEAAVGDDLYLLLVNSTEETMDLNISGFPGSFTVDDLFADTSTIIDQTSLSWQLDVLGVSMLKFHDFILPVPDVVVPVPVPVPDPVPEPQPTSSSGRLRRGRAVPEPSSLVLMGSVLASLVFCNRHRPRRRSICRQPR